MLIINITYHKHSENVVEIIFEALNNDWFSALFPLVDVKFEEMKKHYIGKNFYHTKEKYKGCVFAEYGMDIENK